MWATHQPVMAPIGKILLWLRVVNHVHAPFIGPSRAAPGPTSLQRDGRGAHPVAMTRAHRAFGALLSPFGRSGCQTDASDLGDSTRIRDFVP
ncbi:hypothetical protein A5712_27080 [Mycobacterium sp. E2327]|nr:hypothetical protein A5712_27080 [Mycobacterium sp. E2327]